MDLKNILAIGGKPGLYKLIAQSKSGVIVQGILDNKKLPVNAQSNVSSLDDIAIYTFEGELPLKDIFKNIYEKEEGKNCISHKESKEEIYKYFSDVAPDFDDERVYISDMKKVFQWYNLLLDHEMISFEEEEKEEEVAAEDKKEDA